MNVFIVGLGVMGASYAEALNQKGYRVDGYDQDPDTLRKAINDQIIETGHLEGLKKAELVILALYPQDNILFVQTHKHLFHKDQLITDLSGTKAHMVKLIEDLLPKDVSYVSHHPMAGRELSGYDAKKPSMFLGANFVIITSDQTQTKDEEIIKKLAIDLGFKNIITLDAATHDQLIAYTSQLTHVLAVSLMHMDRFEETPKAIGDSFRDLTRIARINENMWTELFIENKHYLSESIHHMIDELKKIDDMILSDAKVSLNTYLKKAKEKRKQFD